MGASASTPSVAVVGGGLSGLYMARALGSKGVRVTVMERNDHFGGRIHTMPDGFECAASRVHASQHRIIKLCKMLKVPLVQYAPQVEELSITGADGAPLRTGEPRNALSVFDTNVLENTLHSAWAQDTEAGYDRSTHTYSTMPGGEELLDDHDPHKWFEAEHGFGSLVEALTDQLGAMPTVTLETSTLVADVGCVRNKGYRVKSKDRAGVQTQRQFDAVVFAAPPGALRDIHILRKFAHPLAAAVRPEALHRIYAKADTGIVNTMRDKKLIVPLSPLQQVLGVRNSDDWIQVSYSQGDLARHWNHLKLSDKGLFEQRLKDELKLVLGMDCSSLHAIESHYWEAGCHAWIPSFDIPADEARVVVNQAWLKHVFIVGEALSAQQGWMEGALETCELALRAMTASAGLNFPCYKSVADIPKELQFVVIDGRVIDVSAWMAVHPGGCAAIKSHLNTDVTYLWHGVHAPLSMPWRMLLSLQCGWVTHTKQCDKPIVSLGPK